MSNETVIQQIRSILLKDWDPFCVGDNPKLADEYDGFIPTISDLLTRKSSTSALEQYFIKIENELDAPISNENRTKTIKALQKIQII